MDELQRDSMLIELHSNLAVTKALLETFAQQTFPMHVATDEKTAELAIIANAKINKMLWMIGGAVGLVGMAEGAKALGLI